MKIITSGIKIKHLLCILTIINLIFVPSLIAQAIPNNIASDESSLNVAERIDARPVASDQAIHARLVRILQATKWFDHINVSVDEGVVFLSAVAATEEHKEWAKRLARNTQDVVAVVDHMNVDKTSIWDFSPAWNNLNDIFYRAFRSVPIFILAIILFFVIWYVTKFAVQMVTFFLSRRFKGKLLSDVIARTLSIPIFFLGIYIILKILGLTGPAITVLGGTGLLGLAIGLAFRDITENFLASILISIQRPFATKDFIEVAGYTGFVQNVNARSTLLMTLEGNHVQVPNATIYKNTLTNFTANPNSRFDFIVGIGYDDSIEEAQSVALKVLKGHSAVISDPEPLILVEELGASTVNLRVYFWVNIAQYSGLKVRSSVIRSIKNAFDDSEISMPDEAREVVFPFGVPVNIMTEEVVKKESQKKNKIKKNAQAKQEENRTSSAEGDLSSEAQDIEEQAENSRSPEGGHNLLKSN